MDDDWWPEDDQPWWIEVATTAEIQIHAEKERRQEIFGWISRFIINPLVNISMALSVRRRAAKSINWGIKSFAKNDSSVHSTDQSTSKSFDSKESFGPFDSKESFDSK